MEKVYDKLKNELYIRDAKCSLIISTVQNIEGEAIEIIDGGLFDEQSPIEYDGGEF